MKLEFVQLHITFMKVIRGVIDPILGDQLGLIPLAKRGGERKLALQTKKCQVFVVFQSISKHDVLTSAKYQRKSRNYYFLK